MSNLANEGYASTVDNIACETGGTAERARYLWADDAGLDGISLRGALAAPGGCASDDDDTVFGSLNLGSLNGGIDLFGSLGDFGSTMDITAQSVAELAPLPTA